MKSLLAATMTTLLVACANPINQRTGLNYNDMGIAAERAGDYKLAEENFRRALINFRTGNTGDRDISMGLYNLGRIKGHLCKPDEAQALLLEALHLEEKVTGAQSGVTTMRVFELARLSFDHQEYEKAASYFARGIPAVEKLGVADSDPIGLADAMDDYSVALGKIGALEKARATKEGANSLRVNNPGKKAKVVPVRYPQRCPG